MKTRYLALLATVVLLAVLASGATLYFRSGPNPVAALRDRLRGENASVVRSLLGEPAFKLNDDRLWHYQDSALLGQFAEASVADRTLLIEFDEDHQVSDVYLED